MAIVLNRQKAVEYAQKYWDEESGNYNKLFPHLMVMIVQILFLNVGIMRGFQEIQTGMYLLYQELQQNHGLL